MLMQFDPFRESDRLAQAARVERADAAAVSDGRLPTLPGMAPGTIDFTVEQNVLTIRQSGV